MRAYLIIIFQIRQQHMSEVPLSEHNNVVKAFPSDRTDQPFGISILPRGAWRANATDHAQIFETVLAEVKRIVALLSPVVLAVVPFLKTLSEKAASQKSTGVSDAAVRWTSRIVLLVVAAVAPLALWLVMMQLTYWGIGVSGCTETP